MIITESIKKRKRVLAALLALLTLVICAGAALPRSARAAADKALALKGAEGEADLLIDEQEARNREISEMLFPQETKGGRASKGVTMNNDIHMDFSIIRVLISISKQSRVEEIELDLNGEYYFTGDMRVIGGEEEPFTVKVKNIDGVIYAYGPDGEELIHGESLELDRVYVSYTAGYATLHTEGSYNTSATYGANGNNYLGNFVFDAGDNGHLRMINIVPMAHYLYGVVEHEMSYTRKPEALKAQTVAAKCYGMCFMSGTDDYDVEDGYVVTMYQMYRGFSLDPGKMTLIPICLSVLGEGMAYNDRIIPTFYGASNGGETTLPSYIFGPNDTRYDGAYDIRHDDVDFSFSPRHNTLSVTFGEPHPVDATASRFLDFILYKARAAYGIEFNSVLSIENMYAHSPYGSSTRDMRMVYVKASVTDGIMEEPQTVELNFEAKELKTLHLSDLDGSGDSYNSAAPAVFNVTYKMFWGVSTANGYDLYICRHGNGIGLSQHGAAAMAMPEYGGRDHYYILGFYYPNFEYITVKEDDPEVPLLSTLDIAALGRCASANAELRSAPDVETSRVIMDVEPGEHVDIVSVTSDGCWYLVLCGGHMGYLYYTKVVIDMFPAAADAVYTLYDGESQTQLKLHTSPTVFSNFSMLPAGETFTVWASVGGWYYVVTGSGSAGYVPKSNVTLGEAYEASGAEPIISAAGEPFFVTSLDYDYSKPVIGRRRIG